MINFFRHLIAVLATALLFYPVHMFATFIAADDVPRAAATVVGGIGLLIGVWLPILDFCYPRNRP